jgi:hypothetical protein
MNPQVVTLPAQELVSARLGRIACPEIYTLRFTAYPVVKHITLVYAPPIFKE